MKTDTTPRIKPTHVASMGIAVIALGILIPSFFINPYSTVGFAVIIGSLILLGAYALFALNLVKLKGRRVVKWLLLPVILLAVSVGALYAYTYYQREQNNRIHLVGESVHFDDFDITVTKASFTDINLSLEEKFAEEYRLNSPEDCSSLSQDGTYTPDTLWGGGKIWSNHVSGISDADACSERNEARKTISDYIGKNKRLTVDYSIQSKKTVNTKDLAIELALDSGRNPNESMEWLNNGSRWIHKKTTDTRQGITREYYDSWTIFPIYKSYVRSDLGSDINKGLNRKGYIQSDIRNTEQNIDINITYKGESRIVRISR